MSGVENSTYVGGLNQLNPESQDFISQGDDHLKLIKKCLLNTFPGFSRPIDGALFPWSQTPGAISVYAKFIEHTGRIGALEAFISPLHPDGAILRANNNLSDVADPAVARANLGIPTIADVLIKSQNLNDVPDKAAARINLGVPASADVLVKTQNLIDLQDVAIARQNLDVFSKAETFQKNLNLSDVVSAAVARTNLGAAAQADVLLKAQNLNDVPDKALARYNLDVPSNADLVSAISAALIGLSAVTSVNGQLGDVVLDSADVGADPAGSATTAVNAHLVDADPHPQYTTVAEAAAAAPVQSVNGMTGAVTLEEEVLQYANLAAFPVSGAAGTLYIAADSGLIYRWDGVAYTMVGGPQPPGAYMYNTKAEATAAASGLADQSLVMVLVDESLASIKSLYRKESGSLVFKQELLTKDVVDAAVVDAEAAQTAAETARDAAQLSAGVYADTTAGIAATTSGDYFSVPSAETSQSLILYKNNAGSALEVKRYPASDAVLKPSRTGKYNGWPDPFFRRCAVNTDFLGRDRWHPASITTLELAANATFNGRALRKNASGTGNLSGPRIYMDDMSAVAGDTITIRALIVGDGAVVAFPCRPLNSAGSSIGTQQASASTITASATPQLMTVSFVTPAGTDSIYIYPYTNTAGKTFDIVALWAFKGAVADGPEWPTFGDEDFLRLKALETDTNTTNIASNTAAVAAVAESRSVVSASSETVSLNVSSIGTAVSYGYPFTGWGERYTPAGVSFNAVRVKQVGRRTDQTTSAQRWRTLNVVIRTGANSHLTGATVVAVGSATVVESADTLTDVTILLRDPTTNALKTLSDLDFSGGEYFVGIYARTSSGAGASMSGHLATQANSLGQSYYITSASPTAGSWSTWTGNSRLGVQHLLLVSPTEAMAYQPSASFLASIEVTPTVPTPVVVLPPTFYGLQGRENSIYFDNITPAAGSEYYWDISGISVGQQQADRWTWTPTGAAGAVTATISLHDKLSGAQIGSGTISVKAAASTAGTGANKTCLFVGDSLTQAGTYTGEVVTIAGSDVMGATLIGTRGSGSNKHEGRGGWRVDDYATAGRTFYQFTVSGVTTVPAINSTEYTNNGSTFKVQEVSITGGAGTITCERTSGSNAPSASGTLTKSNAGAGDSSISFSASTTVSGNPFWISGALNFPQYLVNNSLATPDWVFIMLGTNDVFSSTSDAAVTTAANSSFDNLDLLIASIKAAGAGVKVALMTPPPPSASQDAFGHDYAVGQTRWRFKRNIMFYNRELIARYGGKEGDRVYICPAHTNLDTVNNMSVAGSAPVNSRSAVSVQRQNNGVHPAAEGYKQIADSVWCFLKNNV